jgi:hypothetical protein
LSELTHVWTVGDKVAFIKDAHVSGFVFRVGLTCTVTSVGSPADGPMGRKLSLSNALLPNRMELEIIYASAGHYLEFLGRS